MTKYGMITIRSAAILIFCNCCYSGFCQDTSSNKLPASAVYTGSTPCDGYVRQLIGIPNNLTCDKIKWELTLFQGAGKAKRYKLKCSYGMQANGSPGLTGGGASIETEGTWIITGGAKFKPDAIVYELKPGGNMPAIILVQMDENILHFLYRDGNLLIGNAGWGYALNKAGDQVPKN
ncbi:MAG TPA: hypothetical protein VJ844_05825 [Mucilaginibacter sp.]|nr:hypothetical protein [Mucilaginibacter sp.]